ncbi:2'-5' RNA ligase family protein [Pseudothauera nasutitermitis]|nr:2'-5' RNA ligase family protein [Pseudothauera nasutitermitis]
MPRYPDLPPGSRCIRNVQRDFPEWHRGRPHYALWGLDVDVPEVRRQVDAARGGLNGLLLDGYVRQPHVTLGLCGFPCADPQRSDDFGPAMLRAQLAALRALRPAPFEIAIGGLNSFASAPYLTVSDTQGQLATLHESLSAGGLKRTDGGFVPHVTVGLYADAWPAGAVRARLADCAAGETLRLSVPRITLFSYAAREIGGTLARLAEYALDGGELCWRENLPEQLAAHRAPHCN